MSDQKTDLENRLVEQEVEYLEREAILSQKIDTQQIEIDMLRRIKRQKLEKQNDLRSLADAVMKAESLLRNDRIGTRVKNVLAELDEVREIAMNHMSEE